MEMIRRKANRVFQNLIAFGIGAIVVALAQGMTPAEIAEFAISNAHQLPEIVSRMVTEAFGPGLTALAG